MINSNTFHYHTEDCFHSCCWRAGHLGTIVCVSHVAGLWERLPTPCLPPCDWSRHDPGSCMSYACIILCHITCSCEVNIHLIHRTLVNVSWLSMISRWIPSSPTVTIVFHIHVYIHTYISSCALICATY